MTLADDLKAAKALIDRPRKWWRGRGATRYWLVYHRHCPVTALSETLPGPDLAERRVAASTALDQNLPSGFFWTPVFNDDPATTHADIMALFDRAIQAAESPRATPTAEAE